MHFLRPVLHAVRLPTTRSIYVTSRTLSSTLRTSETGDVNRARHAVHDKQRSTLDALARSWTEVAKKKLGLNTNGDGARSFSSSVGVRVDDRTKQPTHESRTSATQGDKKHPGFTSVDTPLTSAHPRHIPGVPSNTVPTSQAPGSSTSTSPAHPKAGEQPPEGEKWSQGGTMPPEWNFEEQKRNPRYDPYSKNKNPGGE